MKRQLCRRVLPLFLAALLPLACAPLSGHREARLAQAPHFSPYTSSKALEFLAPAIEAIQARLRAVKKHLPADYQFACQGCYGSAFLKGNPVANDLDYLLDVRLGTLRCDAAKPEALAEPIVGRVETFLGALRSTLDSMANVDLVPLNYPFDLPDGHFARHAEVCAHMAASLRDVLAGKPHLVMVQSTRYTAVPTVLAPDETYLDETLLIDVVTPHLRSSAAMFAGLRRVQICVHFLADLEVTRDGRTTRIANLRIEPVHRGNGAVLDSLQYTLGLVPLDAASAAAFGAVALADKRRAAALRIDDAVGLLLEARRRIAVGDPLKAVKRFQQGFEAIAPAFGPDVAAKVYALAQEGLRQPDLLRAVQMEEMASVLLAVFRNTREPGRYIRSGHVRRVLDRMERDLAALGPRRDAVSAQEAEAVRAGLRRVRDLSRQGAPDPEKVAPILGRVLDHVTAWQPRLYSPAAKMEPLLAILEGKLHDCGLVTLPVRGQADGTLAVLSKDLASVGHAARVPADATREPRVATSGPEADKDLSAKLVAMGAPAFTYRVVGEAALSAAHGGKLPPPSRLLILRAATTPAQKQAYQKLETLLLADMDRFGPARSAPVSVAPYLAPAPWRREAPASLGLALASR